MMEEKIDEEKRQKGMGIFFLTAFLALVPFMICGFNSQSLIAALITVDLVYLSVIDEKIREIPPKANFIFLILAILSQAAFHDVAWFHSGLIGIAVTGGLFLLIYLISCGRAMGGGDVKLMAIAGFYLGWRLAILAFIMACIFGSIIHLLRMKFAGAGRELAFGPYLSMGIYFSMLGGERLIYRLLGISF